MRRSPRQGQTGRHRSSSATVRTSASVRTRLSRSPSISEISATSMVDAAVVTTGVSTMVRSSLGPWAAAWNELVAAAPLPTPFLRAWWLEHVPVHRPRFVLVVEGGELVGGLALEERVVAGISFVRMLG